MKTICEMNSEERVSLKRKAIIYDRVVDFLQALGLVGLIMLLSGFAENVTR